MIQDFSLSRKKPLPTEDASPPHSLLLHVCCAPCACAIIERLLKEGVSPTLFFYNPNIYPRKEYELRKEAIKDLARTRGLPLVDLDGSYDEWLLRIKGLEGEPERGQRCSACFDMRMERTALYAYENGFPFFATTNGISRHKDLDQVHASGLKAANRYPGLSFIVRNWRENDALRRAEEIIRSEGIYKQSYCGCEFSLKESENRRQAKKKSP